MFYYEVLVTSNKFHGNDSLTYSSKTLLEVGQIVSVKLRNTSSNAIVIKKVNKPQFKTKPIEKVLVYNALPKESLNLISWIHEYYPAPISNIANQFVPNELLLNKENIYKSENLKNKNPSTLPNLNEDQKKTIKTIESSGSNSFLIHGITGSGKTRIYLEIAKSTVKNNKSVIILTPEISLTPQMINMIEQFLDAEVILIHSNLTPKQRRESWLKILYSTNPVVVVGPRSALFSPTNNLGLIVIDEFHDTAYKQEQNPHYQSLRVAGALASFHNAKLVYGSATPSVSEYYYALNKGVPIIKLDKLAINNSNTIDMEIVDLKDRSLFGKSQYFSDKLLTSIQSSMDKGEQSLIFLNRRGTARIIMCQNCDWLSLCTNCDIPLTYHGDTHKMRCHTCGLIASPPIICPDCHKPDIIYKSYGTKAIEQQLNNLFPEAKIKRFDTDNTKIDKFEQNYEDILTGKVDIIIGTQLLVKGLDLPKLSTVGVVSADTSLYFPDYTADEQTYQLITQVIGRVSRGHVDGRVVIQTNNPNNLPLQAAIKKDWQLFYEQQISERNRFMYPPFCFLLKLTCSRKTQNSVIESANKVVDLIKKLPIKANIIGPAPRFIEKANGKYNWQITIKSKNRNDLIKIIKILPSNWNYDIDPSNLL